MSDHITLTPSLFYLIRPNGQYTAPGKTSNALGTVLVTIFASERSAAPTLCGRLPTSAD